MGAAGRKAGAYKTPSLHPSLGIQRHRCHPKPKTPRFLLHKWHHVDTGQARAAPAGGGGAKAHPALRAQLEGGRGPDVAAADRLLPVLRTFPGIAAQGCLPESEPTPEPRIPEGRGRHARRRPSPCTQATLPVWSCRPLVPGWAFGGGEPVLSTFQGYSALFWVSSASPTPFSSSLSLHLVLGVQV